MLLNPTPEQIAALARLSRQKDFETVYDWLFESKASTDAQLYAAPTDRFAAICIGEARTLSEILDVIVKAPGMAREVATPPAIPETPH